MSKIVLENADCIKRRCDYKLPHYHCKICGKQINSDDRRYVEYHPCCSSEHNHYYNQFYFCLRCTRPLTSPFGPCPHCGFNNRNRGVSHYRKEAEVKVTNLLRFKKDNPIRAKKKTPRR